MFSNQLISRVYCTANTSKFLYYLHEPSIPQNSISYSSGPCLSLENHSSAPIHALLSIRQPYFSSKPNPSALQPGSAFYLKVTEIYANELKSQNLKEAVVSNRPFNPTRLFIEDYNAYGLLCLMMFVISLFLILLIVAIVKMSHRRQREADAIVFREDLFNKTAPSSPLSKVKKTFDETE